MGGLGSGGPRGKGSSSVSNDPKPPIQLLQLLKNSPREVKRAHFRYILAPPGTTQEVKLMGPGGEGSSRSPPPVFQFISQENKMIATPASVERVENVSTILRYIVF